MGREVGDAHYQHQQRGLSVLLRPPVQQATHLAWDSRGELLVATADGRVLKAHPAMGTSTLLKGAVPPAGLGVDGERFVLVRRNGAWSCHDRTGRVLVEGRHPFEGAVHVQFREGKVLLTGLTDGHKQVLFYDSGRKVLRIQLPPRAVGFVASGHFGLAQSTPIGLETVYLRDNGRFHGTRVTGHRLQAEHDHILGVHGGGVRVWSILEGEHVDVALEGTTVASLSADGRLLAVGTADGEISVVPLDSPADCADPDIVEVTDVPIRSIAFSADGRYLASGADRLLIWSYG